MEIKWNEEDGILPVDGAEFYSEGGDDPVDVRVGVLRALPAAALPTGVKVRAVRKVLGSSRDVYGDPEGVSFVRTDEGGLVVVEDAFFVDADGVSEPERRRCLIEDQMAAAGTALEVAVELGLVLDFGFSEIYDDEIAYLHFRAPVTDLDRPVYEIIQEAPGPDSVLPPASAGSVLAELRSLGAWAGGDEADLLRHVRRLVRATGLRPGDLRTEVRTAAGSYLDAVLQPYETFEPLVLFEVRLQATAGALELAEKYRSDLGAAALVMVAPNLLAVRAPDDSISVEPASATLDQAEAVLQILRPSALSAESGKPVEPAPPELVAMAAGIETTESADSNEDKGKTYEALACLALELVSGLTVKYRNRRTDTAEIDIIAEYVGAPRRCLRSSGVTSWPNARAGHPPPGRSTSGTSTGRSRTAGSASGCSSLGTALRVRETEMRWA